MASQWKDNMSTGLRGPGENIQVGITGPGSYVSCKLIKQTFQALILRFQEINVTLPAGRKHA
jgi:hypothetical protein